MKYSELERKLVKAGCYEVRAGGRHPIWFSPITGKTFPTGHHKSEEVRPGTLKDIIESSGIKF
ncbi:MAG: type II toxin-antitoxin system HicA family toxin [Candidatus Symbiothrix sp.]|jgi:predicted RNA binding protein YcfA (HicA-like mRNA interferase family)|nr:type II toxin-antitoxin system HicA family toxin [Candidatus Symbiothrix sp.]